MTRYRYWRWLAVCCVTTMARPAQADNLDSLYMSGDAAVQAGAITADAEGGGSVWYNPAGLARLRGIRFDASISAYTLRFGGAADLDPVGNHAVEQRLGTVDFIAAPAGISVAKRLDGLTVGFGVFVPRVSTASLRSKVSLPPTASAPGVELSVDSLSQSQDLYLGPGVGFNLGRDVEFGFSMLMLYRAASATQDLSESVSSLSGVTGTFDDHMMVERKELGVQPTFGAQMSLPGQLRLGMVVRLPAFRFFERLLSSHVQSSAAVDISHSADYQEVHDISFAILQPARFHLGLSRHFERSRLAVDFGYQEPLHDDGSAVTTRAVINARIGGLLEFANGLGIGGGLYTNLSPYPPPRSLGEVKVDYYGVTVATHFGTKYIVAERSGKKLDLWDLMTFGTTFAFSYEFGIGQSVHGQVGAHPSANEVYREVPVQVTAHSFIWSVGSSIVE